MFFGSYIGALELTALRDHVPTLVFDWERHIPFLAWTVVPYWSEDLFYALSLFLCLTRAELNRHALRLVLAQAVAIPIFLLFPLRLVSTIPADTGIWAPWFAALGDVCTRPFNLAPSLHVAIAIILGVRYAKHLRGPWRRLSNAWFTLVALSTLTTWQHHFFDIPTGAMLGAFCVWALPDEGASPLHGLALTHDPRRRRLASRYVAGALACLGLAWGLGGAALWLLWPAQSLLLVALAYGAAGERLFQKDAQGRMSAAALVLLYPYVLGARLGAALFTRNLPDSEIADGVRLGRLAPAGATASVVDLSAELPAPPHADWRCLPSLDLVPPAPELLCDAARHIEARVADGQTVLVCCALGFSRSAAAVATWLAASGRVTDVDGALARVRAARPRVVLGDADRAVIHEAVRRLREAR
ncbi:MAG: phosphatase PAP2/dual specificity phosphatase family protein [Myxococcota bacterium]